jgi:hypothetical protein
MLLEKVGEFDGCLYLHCSKVGVDLGVCKCCCGDFGGEKLFVWKFEERKDEGASASICSQERSR